PHGLRRRVRGYGRRIATCRCAAGRGVAAGHANGRPQRDLPRRDRTAGSPARQTDDGMKRLVEVPAQFDDRSFDQFAGAFAAANKDDERLLFDAHAAEWASPYGLVGLLRSEEHTSELQSRFDLVCRLLLEKKNTQVSIIYN